MIKRLTQNNQPQGMRTNNFYQHRNLAKDYTEIYTSDTSKIRAAYYDIRSGEISYTKDYTIPSQL